jgi:hypothetical protein
MAINSYDNGNYPKLSLLSSCTCTNSHLVLRVCDRGLDPPKSDMRLVHTLKGFKNKNWPIKSSFYTGKECMYCRARRTIVLRLPQFINTMMFEDNASIPSRQNKGSGKSDG